MSRQGIASREGSADNLPLHAVFVLPIWESAIGFWHDLWLLTATPALIKLEVGVGCFAKAKQIGVGCFAKAKQICASRSIIL
jgi:hypothetical protein